MQIKEPVKILDVPVHPLTMGEAVSVLEESITSGEQAFVVTANAEIIMMCQEDAGYKKIVSQDAQLVLPDGAGAVWAGRHLGYKVPERVAGFDLYCQLLDKAAQKGYKAFFFGGSPGIAEAAKAKSEELYPGVQVVGCRNGYFKEEESQAIIDEINASAEIRIGIWRCVYMRHVLPSAGSLLPLIQNRSDDRYCVSNAPATPRMAPTAAPASATLQSWRR